MHACMQVHVLIASSGHEPPLPRALQRAAQLLTAHSLWHTETLAPLLPPRATPVLAPGLQQALRVAGGSLGVAASGDPVTVGMLSPCMHATPRH